MRKFEAVIPEMREGIAEIKFPTKATRNSSAYDIYSPIDTIINPNESKMIWTGIKALFNENEVLLINVRSSMGKKNIMLANTQGWIDSDYYENEQNDGNIGINLFNFGTEPFIIKRGQRIAQCMLTTCINFDMDITTNKRKGGFGSTDDYTIYDDNLVPNKDTVFREYKNI